VAALALAIAVLSLVPDPETITPVTVWDKLGHAVAYAALALALGYAMAASRWAGPAVLVAGVALPVAYGALLELLQLLTPPRSGEAADVLANLAGALAGTAALAAWNLRGRKS